MLTRDNIDDLLKHHGNVLSTDGDKIGSIVQVYADDANGEPTWVTVKTGLFGRSESFVPLEGARIDGDDIVVPYSKDQVKEAPRTDADGHLEPSEEGRLYEHYRLTGGPRTYTEAITGGYDDAGGTVGGNAPGGTVNDAVTRSGERLNAGAARQAPGPSRLRKYAATGNDTAGEEIRKGRGETDGTRR